MFVYKKKGKFIHFLKQVSKIDQQSIGYTIKERRAGKKN